MHNTLRNQIFLTMKKNSKQFVVAYDAITTRAKVYREESATYGCSLGKFLADLVCAVLDSQYIPLYPDERIEGKTITLDAYRNLQAIVKETDPITGQFVIREKLVDSFTDLENHALQCIKFPDMTDAETNVIAHVVTLCHLYKNGKFYAHELDSLLLKN